MTLDLSHLAVSVKEEAFHDAPTRIRFVQTARWVEFARGRLALEELERRYQYPSCARMPCMLLYGDSGMGKTMLIEKMERQHPNSHHERRGLTLRPVLRVQMPASPDERRFYTRLLEILGAPYASHDQIGALENRVLHIFAEIGTKLLCIDEVHHLLAGSQREQRRALNLLKFVANELKIAVVAVGTHDAFHAMQIDAQVASRFEPLLLPRWTEIDGFRGFVTGYGRLLPLRRPSPFGEAAMIRTLLELSGGITGRVTALLARAAEASILDGSEHIDPVAIVKRTVRRGGRVSASLAPWPVCPPPHDGESLHSWFERVAAFYGLSAHRMLSSVARGLPKPRPWSDTFKVGVALTGNRKVARRLIALSGLSPWTLTSLRPARTGWELPRQEFRAYCPRCCLEDLDRGETPYGRLIWQQAWYTVCRVHRIPLLLRRTTSGAFWRKHQLQQDASLAIAAALGYQHAKHPQRERFYIQYALLELQGAIQNALAGVRPRRRQWGVVSAENFLRVLGDVTTWSLTHFETVRSWSLAEDLTPIEIADGLKLLGHARRMTPADYAADRTSRSLVDVEDPAVRGSALWLAHSVMASFHQDVSDRQTAYRRTSRQEIKYAASPPAARAWLASGMSTWPERYRSKCWLNPQS